MEKWNKHLELAAKALPVMAGASLAISIAYDFGYLYGLGMSFEDVPTTIADHARSVLVWFPWAIVLTLVFGLPLIPYTTPSPSTIASSGATPPRRFRYYDQRSGRWLWLIIVAAIIVILALRVVLNIHEPASLALILVLVWGMIFLEIVHYTPLRYSIGIFTDVLLYTPIVLIFFFSLGHLETYVSRQQVPLTTNSTLLLKMTGQGPLRVKVLRHFERFVLVVLPSGEVQIINSSDVLSIARDKPTSPEPPLHVFCKKYAILCER